MSFATADVLVVAPHPDDAEICAGGSIARWVREGRRVVYALCTSGDKGSSDPLMDRARLAALREAEQQAAAQVLGVGEVLFLRYPDQELEDTPAFRKALVRLIRTWRPGTVVTADPYRRYINHRDHRITGQACLDAVFPCARDVLAYPDLCDEGLMPHKVREMLFWMPETSNFGIDITATFAQKVEALRCHQSQLAGIGAADVEQWLHTHASAIAAGEGGACTESFYRVELPP